MNSDDVHNIKKRIHAPDGDKEPTIDMAAKDPVRQMVKDLIFRFLNGHSVIIWGSGASVPLGFPTTNQLLESVERNSGFFGLRDVIASGFEDKLSKFLSTKDPAEREGLVDKVSGVIGDEIRKHDVNFGDTRNEEYFHAMYQLYSFLKRKPFQFDGCSVDILTTNYDCSWEWICKQNGISVIDGFLGGFHGVDYLGLFPEKCRESIRLVKVHGSSNWFRYKTQSQCVVKAGIGERPGVDAELMVPKIIIPSNLKYEEVVTDMTFSNLMLAFGRLIKEADSYLTVGFGFNDLHLTPLLQQEAMNGKPVVRLMKDMTRGGEVFAESLPNVLTISNGEERIMRNSCISWREGGKRESLTVFEDDLWSLPSFVKLLNEKQI